MIYLLILLYHSLFFHKFRLVKQVSLKRKNILKNGRNINGKGFGG